jgi:hypothetical protein
MAWNARSESTIFEVAAPSRSRMSPALVEGMGVVTGCT